MKHTNKELFIKGIKYMVLALVFLIASPYLLTLSFINNTLLLFLIPGLITGFFALYFMFKGLTTIVKSLS